MSARLRLLVFLAGGLLGMPLALCGLSGLPAFGTGSGALGDLILGVGLPERHAINLVSAIMFDYRGLDTLIEEFVFMAAVLGLLLLLRPQGSEVEGVPPDLPRGRPHLIGCLSIAQSSTYVLLLSVGYRTGAGPPILEDSSPAAAVDPVVQALVLTDVVVGTAVTGLLLALAIQLHKHKGTLDPGALRPLRDP